MKSDGGIADQPAAISLGEDIAGAYNFRPNPRA
jgi:hypothetical protein